MSDDNPDDKAESPPPDAAATAAENQPDRKFSQDDVDKIVTKRLAADRRARAKEQEAKASSPTKEDDRPTGQTADPGIAELKAKLEFREALDDLEWKPSKEDRDTLADMFSAKGLDAMTKLATRLKPAPAETSKSEPPTGGGTYRSPGAPSGAPPEVLDRDATRWSKDYIDQQRAAGTFLSELEKYRGSLPGGSNGLFRKRIPKA